MFKVTNGRFLSYQSVGGEEYPNRFPQSDFFFFNGQVFRNNLKCFRNINQQLIMVSKAGLGFLDCLINTS